MLLLYLTLYYHRFIVVEIRISLPTLIILNSVNSETTPLSLTSLHNLVYTIAKMIDLFLLALIAGLVAVAYLLRSQKKKNLPPSPIGFPVIGHLYLLKEPVHRSLRDLSRNLGNMFFLRLGSRRAVVVTSASAFDQEFLSQQNDIVFANRPMATLNEYMTYNNTIVAQLRTAITGATFANFSLR